MKAHTIAASTISFAWIYLLSSSYISNHTYIAAIAFIPLYGITCAAILKLHKIDLPIHWLIKAAAFYASLSFTLVAYSFIKTTFEAIPPTSFLPKDMKLVLFLSLQILIPALMALLLFIPLCGLFKRTYWLAPVLVAIFSLYLEANLLNDPKSSLLSNSVIIFQVLSLGLGTPLLMALLWRLQKNRMAIALLPQ